MLRKRSALAALVIGALVASRLSARVEGEKRPGLGLPLHRSRANVIRLAGLFAVDSFAGGFVVQSLLALWLFERFELSLATASVFFFWASTATAFSYPVAARLARHIGLINTMVFTHIPSSVLLIVAALDHGLMAELEACAHELGMGVLVNAYVVRRVQSWIDRLIERIPGVNILCAHNVVIATVPASRTRAMS